MRIILFIGLVCSCLLGCTERQVQIAGIPQERIDFFSLERKNINEIPQQCISKVRYVNISADSPELLFSSIDKIQIENQKIYILDRSQRLLGVFDRSGKAIGKVGEVGRGPEEYLNLTDFSVDKQGRVVLLDGRSDKINIYDDQFNFVSSVKLPFEADILQSLGDQGYLLGLSSWNKGWCADDKIIKVDSNLKPMAIFCQYEKDTDPNYWISTYQFLRIGKSIIYNRFLDNHVYLFSAEGRPVKDVYFDFGKKNVPAVAKSEIESKEELYEHLCCLKKFTIVTDDYVLGYVWDERTDKIFLIDKPKNVLYVGKPEPFNKLGKVVGVCDEGIISCIYPGEYMDDKAKTGLPEEVRNHLTNEGVVICLYTFVPQD